MNEVIQGHLEDDIENALFFAALGNLGDRENPVRFNNFAYVMRELARHVMARLAPDHEVRNCAWYEGETGRVSGISRRQRVNYAVQGGLSDEYVGEEVSLDIEDIHRQLRDAIDNLSKHTHIERKTFNLSDKVIERHVEETLGAVVDFFQTISRCRSALVSTLAEQIDASVVDAAISETILSIDELASHHTVDAIYTENVRVKRIDAHFICSAAEGTTQCELQWGSSSDRRRGDGAILRDFFPIRRWRLR